jgi:hypothetical protein
MAHKRSSRSARSVRAAKVKAPKVRAAKVKAPKVKAPKVRAAKVKAPKVPRRFRALGGVDPRALPEGSPYACNDPYVGARVAGDNFAGKIIGCATPPAGKRGPHFVVGALASGAQIGAAWRRRAKDAETFRARYEGPDFDARTKRRAKGTMAPPAPRPMLALPAPATPARPRRSLAVMQPLTPFKEAISAQLAARFGRASERGVDVIAAAIRSGQFNDLLRPENKTSRDVFSFFTGVKLPTTEKGTRALFTGQPFPTIPAARWLEGTGPAADAERAEKLWRDVVALMRKSFGPDHFQASTFPPGSPRPKLPNVSASVAAMGATSVQNWRGSVPLRLYVALLADPNGNLPPSNVVAFRVFQNDPMNPAGLFGGVLTGLAPATGVETLRDYLKQHGVGG